MAVRYEAGPDGYRLHLLLGKVGVECDVIAPLLIPIRAGAWLKTDRGTACACTGPANWRSWRRPSEPEGHGALPRRPPPCAGGAAIVGSAINSCATGTSTAKERAEWCTTGRGSLHSVWPTRSRTRRLSDASHLATREAQIAARERAARAHRHPRTVG